MDDSGDLDILERQVSLLKTLLGNLERRRDHRRRTPEPPPAAPARGLETSEDVALERTGLRLVEEPPVPPPEPGRKPHFRRKRRWNLSGPAASEQMELEVNGQSDSEAEADPRETIEEKDAPVPWQAFQQLLRERDDLLLQLSHHQSAEPRLMEERAAGERKDQEIRKLQEALHGAERSGMRDLIGHLQGRVRLAEEWEGRVVQRMVEDRGAEPGEPPGSRPQSGAQAPPEGRNAAVMVRGCQVELATEVGMDGLVYAFAVATRRQPGGLVRKGFHALGDSVRETELACVGEALRHLDHRAAGASATREVLRVEGRQVEILCDTVGDGTWQAFPFLHEGGTRRILLRFHIQEALTASSAAQARRLCIERLGRHFRLK